MNVTNCYQVLGLQEGASFREIKASYRQLARRYHPDVNSSDGQARDKFIELTEAYKFLLSIVPPDVEVSTVDSTTAPVKESPQPPPPPEAKVKVKVTRKRPRVDFVSPLSEADQKLKDSSYQQLQQFLQERRFPRAIALVEGLAQRIPHDREVRQWQAITYQRWGRHLAKERQVEKARAYLKKALKTDPHNRSLGAEVERDFRHLEQIY